jgi:ribosomal protein S14
MVSVFDGSRSWRNSDIKKRSNFRFSEAGALALGLYRDAFLHKSVSTLDTFTRQKNFSKVSIKNVCLVSGRSGSTLTKFRLSRISFRTLALSGKLPGIRKAAW